MCQRYAKHNISQLLYILESNFFISQDDVEPYFEAYHCLGEMMEKSQYKASNPAQACMKYTCRVASSLQCVFWGHTTITSWTFWRPFLYCYDCIMKCNIGLHKLFCLFVFWFVGLSFCSTSEYYKYLCNQTIHLEISYSVFHSKFVITNDSLSVILILYEDCPSVAAWRSSDIQQSTCFAQPNSHEAKWRCETLAGRRKPVPIQHKQHSVYDNSSQLRKTKLL